jgi:hypothetical protein
MLCKQQRWAEFGSNFWEYKTNYARWMTHTHSKHLFYGNKSITDQM